MGFVAGFTKLFETCLFILIFPCAHQNHYLICVETKSIFEVAHNWETIGRHQTPVEPAIQSSQFTSNLFSSCISAPNPEIYDHSLILRTCIQIKYIIYCMAPVQQTTCTKKCSQSWLEKKLETCTTLIDGPLEKCRRTVPQQKMHSVTWWPNEHL